MLRHGEHVRGVILIPPLLIKLPNEIIVAKKNRQLNFIKPPDIINTSIPRLILRVLQTVERNLHRHRNVQSQHLRYTLQQTTSQPISKHQKENEKGRAYQNFGVIGQLLLETYLDVELQLPLLGGGLLLRCRPPAGLPETSEGGEVATEEAGGASGPSPGGVEPGEEGRRGGELGGVDEGGGGRGEVAGQVFRGGWGNRSGEEAGHGGGEREAGWHMYMENAECGGDDCLLESLEPRAVASDALRIHSSSNFLAFHAPAHPGCFM